MICRGVIVLNAYKIGYCICHMQCVQYTSTPHLHHWEAVKRIFGYLCNTIDFGIRLTKMQDSKLIGWYNADWTSDRSDSQSQTGFLVYLEGSLVSWASKKQSTISRSSTEVEYRSITTTVQELEWLKSLLQELGITVVRPMEVMCDNLGATHLMVNPIYHAKTKHVAIDLHFVCERVEDKGLQVHHVVGTKQREDILTKPFGLHLSST